MITLKTEELKAVCTKIRDAVDKNGAKEVYSYLEIIIKSGVLYLQVTGEDYFVKVKLATNNSEDFHATVRADAFIELISSMTTELITLDVNEKSLIIRGNGEYPLPIIYDGENILTLEEIDIENVTNIFDVDGDVLNSIYTINAKLLSNSSNTMSELQHNYYVDNRGAITSTRSSACINDFNLEQDVKLLFPQKVVKLFKLFKNCNVTLSIGKDKETNNSSANRVKLVTPEIEITSITATDEYVNKYASDVVRNMKDKDYDNLITLNRLDLLQTV